MAVHEYDGSDEHKAFALKGRVSLELPVNGIGVLLGPYNDTYVGVLVHKPNRMVKLEYVNPMGADKDHWWMTDKPDVAMGIF